MHLGILGFGLIGGSLARALRERGRGTDEAPWSIAAWSPGGTGPAAALADGVIDLAAARPETALEGADLVVLAGPPAVCLGQLDHLAGGWRSALTPDAVITDVASTKRAIVQRATVRGLRFVGGHPMAGREQSGYGASRADLFQDRPWVLVPTADEAAVERVERLVTATGARPVRMAADAHDEAVAAISHLPLVVAAALVEAVTGGPSGQARPDWPAASGLASSGWRDTTRVARGDVQMGIGIMATNGPAVAARVRDLIVVLEGWLADLEGPDGPDEVHLARRLERARGALEAMTR
jgi:prephenate dehydrogenase